MTTLIRRVLVWPALAPASEFPQARICAAASRARARSAGLCLVLLLGLWLAACSSDDERTVVPEQDTGGVNGTDADADASDGTEDLPDVLEDTGSDAAEGTDGLDAGTDADVTNPDDGGTGDGDTGGTDGTDGTDGGAVGDGSIGAACTLDNHCDGDALCLNWFGGYCTVLNCPVVAECPSDSACVTIQQGTTACLDLCDSQDDCRPGYGCKPLQTTTGETVRGCIGLDETVAPSGGPCESHQGCEGALVCLPFVEEGYCAELGCSADTPCADGAVCVTYNGAPTCLPTCATTDDCLVAGAKERVCGPLLDIEAQVAQVCIPATEGVGVGSDCTTDIQCDSGQCRILAEGKCVTSNLGCFTDEDCPGAGVCELAPAYVKGTCTQACADDLGCPGNAQCVDTADGQAWCSVPCNGLSDTTKCDKNVGEKCLFGDPVGDTTGGGKYACAILKAGDPGTDCATAEDCKGDAVCNGTCAPTCGDGLDCPFPTTCVTVAGTPRCLKRCFSIADCPTSYSCKEDLGTFTKVCVP